MLLQTFEKDEKLAFAELAKIMIAVDGVFDHRELQMYKDICIEMGIEEDDVYKIENKSIEDLILTFATRNAQLFALLELLSIAFVDENYVFQEKNLIEKLSKIVNIEKDQMLKMQEWGKNRIQLGKDLLDIINM